MKRITLFTNLLLFISFFAYSQNGIFNEKGQTYLSDNETNLVKKESNAFIYRDETCPRTILIEHFTGSSCPYCLPGNIALSNVLSEYDEPYALIKYQMDWPGNGDPYYTAEGGTRKTLYSVTVVPFTRVQGSSLGIDPRSLTKNHLTNLQNVAANLELDVEYSVEGKTVSATVTINPKTDISGTNLRLYVAIVERITFENWKTTPNQSNGEKEFEQVMKKFIPDASGIVLSDLTTDTPVVFEQQWEFKGNYRKPNNAQSPINHATEHSVENFENLAIVAWVQNTSTKQVLQACQKDSKYFVNFKTVGTNGIVTASVDGENIENKDLIISGEEVVFTAHPNESYKVKEWKVNGKVVEGAKSNQLVIPELEKDINVTVEFFISHYNVIYSVYGGLGGTLTATADGEPFETGEAVERELEIVFTATPDEGYEVKEWRYNGSLVQGNNTSVFRISSLVANATVSVVFQTTHLIVSYGVVNETGGTLIATVLDEEIESNDLVPRRSRVFFTATPKEGYIVKEWRNNGIVIPNNLATEYVINSLSINVNVTVEFLKTHTTITYSAINDEFGTLTATIDGETFESGETFETGLQVIFTAEPIEEYEVKEWIINGEVTVDYTDNEYIIEFLDDDVEISVEFIKNAGIISKTLSDVVLYPNPFKNEIKIVGVETRLIASLQIFDAIGVMQKADSRRQNGEIVIDVSNLYYGIYYVTIESITGDKVVHKMVKK
jgi:hypothetical protein